MNNYVINIEKGLNVKLPYDAIKISKDVLDTYSKTDIELKEFLEHNNTAPKAKESKTTFLDIVKKYLSWIPQSK